VNVYNAALTKWPELGGELRSWLRGVYRERWGREEIAALGGLVAVSAYGQPDFQHALMIGGAADLLDQVRVVNQLLYPGSVRKTPVVLQGGLGQARSYRETFLVAMDMFRQTPGSSLRLGRARHTPVAGALFLAAEGLGVKTLVDEVRMALR
jgi:hypothetical protein